MAKPRRVSPLTLATEKARCDFCGAEPGKRCTKKNGRPYQCSHGRRHWAAVAAGYWPVPDDPEGGNGG